MGGYAGDGHRGRLSGPRSLAVFAGFLGGLVGGRRDGALRGRWAAGGTAPCAWLHRPTQTPFKIKVRTGSLFRGGAVTIYRHEAVAEREFYPFSGYKWSRREPASIALTSATISRGDIAAVK